MEGAKPDFNTLQVAAQFWPADTARMMLGDRIKQLPTLRAPLVNHVFGIRRPGACDTPAWSDFVTQKMSNTAILALPSELGGIRSIDIQHDIDGLADRIASALNKRLPTLRIATVHKRLPEPSDATLDFNVVCRCNENGAPDGFYVREAVLYKPAITHQWEEPTRVLFYWSDGGSPPWRRVPNECFGRKDLSATCRAAFQDADIAFVTDLASTLDSGWRQR